MKEGLSAMNQIPPQGTTDRRIAIIILAAGDASRFGRPKQLLHYQGAPLIARAVEAATGTPHRPVFVVVGANARKIFWKLADYHVVYTSNPRWDSGISSSIRVGLKTALDSVEFLDAALFMTADQPLVTTRTLERLIEAWMRTGRPIAASRYADTLGIPALFASPLFSTLLSLKGDQGAKEIILAHRDRTAEVDAPEAAVDIDSEEDLIRLENTTSGRG
jgi:molybdenum cofactor cytidylyltransferase